MVTAIQRLHARGLTILLVEQNVGVAAALARHAHVLMNGEVALSAPAADLLRNPDVLRSYLGR
jgi:branched-chain amino acid transport system ATP-binding protein